MKKKNAEKLNWNARNWISNDSIKKSYHYFLGIIYIYRDWNKKISRKLYYYVTKKNNAHLIELIFQFFFLREDNCRFIIKYVRVNKHVLVQAYFFVKVIHAFYATRKKSILLFAFNWRNTTSFCQRFLIRLRQPREDDSMIDSRPTV